MKKYVVRITVGLAVGLVGIQFIRPDQSDPVSEPSKSITAIQRVPADVSAIMDRACGDCHSDHTVWPWYAGVAPVSWLIADDVKEGRRHLNFSEWGNYTKLRKTKKMSQMAEVINDRSMPLPKYILLHSEAALSAEDRKLFSSWAEKEADRMEEAVPDTTD